MDKALWVIAAVAGVVCACAIALLFGPVPATAGTMDFSPTSSIGLALSLAFTWFASQQVAVATA